MGSAGWHCCSVLLVLQLVFKLAQGAEEGPPIGFTYIGCFIDSGNRDLEHAAGAIDGGDEDDPLGGPARVMACATACTGYQYMGLQYNNDCFCDNDYGGQGEADMSDCDGDGVLTGGVADACGAGTPGGCGWRNAVYQINYRDTSGNEMDTTDCVIAEIGRGPQTSPAPVAAGYVCPEQISRANWLGESRNGLTFAVTQNADGAATVTRTDRDKNQWHMDLRFRCCRATAGYLYMGCFVDVGGDGRLMKPALGAQAGADGNPDENESVRTITPGVGALDECAAACAGFACELSSSLPTL